MIKLAEITGNALKSIADSIGNETFWFIFEPGTVKSVCGSSIWQVEKEVIADVETPKTVGLDSNFVKKIGAASIPEAKYEILCDEEKSELVIRQKNTRNTYKAPYNLTTPYFTFKPEPEKLWCILPTETMELIIENNEASLETQSPTQIANYAWFSYTEEQGFKCIVVNNYYLTSYEDKNISSHYNKSFGILSEHLIKLKKFLKSTTQIKFYEYSSDAFILEGDQFKFLMAGTPDYPNQTINLILNKGTSEISSSVIIKNKKMLLNLLKLADSTNRIKNSVHLTVENGKFYIKFEDSGLMFKDSIEASVWGVDGELMVNSKYLYSILSSLPEPISISFEPSKKWLIIKSNQENKAITSILAGIKPN
jgi:hypothetical protein